MSQATWSSVDSYIERLFGLDDEVLRHAVAAGDDAGLPPIQVSAAQGMLLNLLARWGSARRVLEIGTLAGYSTIWLARALPADGRLVTLEIDQRHAEVARANLQRAGLGDLSEIIVGPALESLPGLAEKESEPFDLVFIDADKESYPDYLEWALGLCRSGGLILADNVVRGGAVAEQEGDDSRVAGVRRYLELAAHDERLESTVLQTVGSKGYDGLAISLVR
ncbi:MAG TPA: O-methyltransferase [Candidatus Limnocylindria bacterium]|nr:O-methyltransferase [Candidatus Limnocylindria bacterium]